MLCIIDDVVKKLGNGLVQSIFQRSLRYGIFLCVMVNLLNVAHGQARDTAPRFQYQPTTLSTKFDTPQQAFEAYKAQYANTSTTILDFFEAPTSFKINNKPSIYWFHYKREPDCPESCVGDGIGMNTECDEHLQPVTETIAAGQSYFYYCHKPETKKEPDPKQCKANPVYPSTGTKEQPEADYQGAGTNGLQFVRRYRSDHHGWAHNYQVFGIDFSAPAANTTPPPVIPFLGVGNACYSGIGAISKEPYCFQYISRGPNPAYDFALERGNDRMLDFGTATDFSPAGDINDRITRLTDANGNTIGWNVYNAAKDATERYDATGRLQTVTARNGQVQTLSYSDSATPATTAPGPGLLLKVTDQFGRELKFTYDSQARLHTMTDPAGGIYTYTYDEPSSIVVSGSQPVSNLTSVTYPDGKKRIYWYNEQDKTGNTNQPYALTGITDENNVRYATWTYNVQGQAASSEHAGSAEKYTFNYGSLQTTMTDPLGSVYTYTYQDVLGVAKLTGQSQPGGSGCGPASSGITYDANGNVATRTDFNGVVTKYGYDLIRNLETSRVEAFGTAQARTSSTQWHATYRIPTVIAEPLRRISFTHDANGNVLTRTEQATTDASGSQGFSATLTGTPRTWTTTYNAASQIQTVKGPRTDINDLTGFNYNTQGNLVSITNAAGHPTLLSNYDAHGHVGRIVDPNGVTTDILYYPRGWLKQVTVTDGALTETTVYSRDDAGQLTSATLPGNVVITYTYDPAHRLTDMQDNLGNKIHYVLDNMGNRLNEQVKDPGGNLTRQVSRLYDALNRLQQVTGNSQ